VLIATSETNPAFVGKTLREVADNQEITVSEAMLNVISGTNAQVEVFDHNLSEEVLTALLKHPLSVVSTDGAGYEFRSFFPEGLVHPRCFGAFPKFLSMVREKKLMSWPEAIKKITSRPAEKLGLSGRGKLLEGNFADVVVFDPHDVKSLATYENPYIQSDGIDYVVLNGELAVDKGEVTRIAAGKVLRV
jgi:N-acyl-D-amino-acid deacylase